MLSKCGTKKPWAKAMYVFSSIIGNCLEHNWKLVKFQALTIVFSKLKLVYCRICCSGGEFESGLWTSNIINHIRFSINSSVKKLEDTEIQMQNVKVWFK